MFLGYTTDSPQVQWLWEILDSLDQSERAEFLQFVTGSSKIPLDGFKGLVGHLKLKIARINSDDPLRLPSRDTW